MTKSWANPLTIGYEIKVSRSDFVHDDKWQNYLPCCNQFYFVAPKDIIDPSELSNDVGLLVVAGDGTGTRLLTKKKAPYRNIEIPESLYRYILMCRVQIAPEQPTETTVGYWRKWLEEKTEGRRLGYRVSKAIRERATEIEIENTRLQQQMRTYDGLLATLKSLDFEPETWNAERELRDRIEARRKVFDRALVNKMRAAKASLDEALNAVDKIETANLETVKVNAA